MKDRIGLRIDRVQPKIAAFRKYLLLWYRRHGRRFPWRSPRASRYERVVSEVLLQRTRARTAAEFYSTFITRYPDWQTLGTAKEAELRSLLTPIGLWQRRAAALASLGREMRARKGKFPRDRAELEKLPGVGQYVANAVMLFCHASHEPLLDVNMARVLERCFGSRRLVDIRYDPWLQAIAKAVVCDRRAAEINWAVLDLAAKVCTAKNPACLECPVQACCQYYRAGALSRAKRRKILMLQRTRTGPHAPRTKDG